MFFSIFAFPSLHPLFGITISWILGIWYSSTQSSLYAFILISTILAFMPFIYNRENRYSYTLLISFLIAALGGAWSLPSQHKAYNISLYTQKPDNTLLAIIDDITPIENFRFTHRLTVKTVYINRQSYASTFFVYIAYPSNCHVGDIITIDNTKIKISDTASSFGQYLQKEQIHGTIFTYKQNITIIYRPAWSFKYTIWQLRERIYHNALQGLSKKAQLLISSLFFGNKAYNKEALKALNLECTWWGIVYYLARSGLHLIIMILIWQFLFSFLPINYITKQLLILALVLVYNLLSWSSLSFGRALYMFIVYKIALILHKQTQTLHVLSLITLLILIINPLQLFFLDFQLSFGLTCALAWLQQTQRSHIIST